MKLGRQYTDNANDGRNSRRIIGLELRIAPAPGYQEEEVFMTGLDIELPDNCPPGTLLHWSVTIHATNGDTTMGTQRGTAMVQT